MMNSIGPPYWDDGRSAILVAGGPSLIGFDFCRLAKCNAWIVGINESIFHLPRCDCGVSADRVFVERRHDQLKEKIGCGMEMVISLGTVGRQKLNAIYLRRRLTNKLSESRTELITCGSSGYAALNVAYLKRARSILLLGYDYSSDGLHYHQNYEWHTPPKRAGCWHFWAAFYESTKAQLDKAKIEVLNASPDSAITAFRKVAVEDGLRWLEIERATA